MRASELSAELRRLYHGAAAGEKVTNIHLFGIRFADHLSGQALRDICLEADVPVSYVAEIHKGIRLAPHVMAKS